MTDAATARTGARVLLLDPDGRVLLIHETIDVGTHWLTPGGGVEGNESLALAAVRELYEETGLRIELDANTPPVHVTRRRWSWAGAHYDQTDHFFVVHLTDRPAVRPAAPTEMELQTLLEMRWWSAAELRALPADVVIEPRDLAELLDRVQPPDGPAA